jgi:hypothetical protein
MARAVHFKGRPVIMKAFSNIQLNAWAIVQDNRLIYKCAEDKFEDSETMLEEFLKSLERSNTGAIYELRVYEDLKDRKKIKLSTEPDFSYNFALFDAEEYPAPGTITRREGYARLEDRFDALEAKLALLKKEDDEEEEDDTVGAPPPEHPMITRLMGILDNPKVQAKIGDLTCGFLDKILAPGEAIISPPKQIHAMGNVNDQQPITEITQENLQKIQAAVEILAGIDPDFGDNLMKIAQLAQKNPKRYKSLIPMLNTFL